MQGFSGPLSDKLQRRKPIAIFGYLLAAIAKPLMGFATVWPVQPHRALGRLREHAERLDVHNGILLSALWDAAFDKGLTSFADDGTPLASPYLSAQARAALNFGNAPRLAGLRDAHLLRLRRHRLTRGFLASRHRSEGAR